MSRVDGCLAGFLLGFLAMLATVSAVALGVTAVAAWYITRQLPSQRLVLSVSPLRAAVAASLAALIAALFWIALIIASARAKRHPSRRYRDEGNGEWGEQP